MATLGSTPRDIIALAVLHHSLADNDSDALKFADTVLEGLVTRGFMVTTKEELLNHANPVIRSAGERTDEQKVS